MIGRDEGPAFAANSTPHRSGASIDRRELLAAVSALVAALGLPVLPTEAATAPPQAIEINAFRDLTVALTGFAPRDAALPDEFLEAFAAEAASLSQLHSIVRDTPPEEWDAAIDAAGLGTLAEALVQAWYTGTVGEGAEQRVLTYLDAFVWYACGYTKPPSQCDTDFGAWADAPPRGRFSE